MDKWKKNAASLDVSFLVLGVSVHLWGARMVPGWSNDTSATCEMTAVSNCSRQSRRKHLERCSLCSWRSPCTRIRRRVPLRSCLSTGHCHGRTCWTSCRPSSWAHHRRYPSTRPREGCSWSVSTVQRTNRNLRNMTLRLTVKSNQIKSFSVQEDAK